MSIHPENINNDDADFLFQQKLYVGTGTEQFEVRNRFENNEHDILETKTAVQNAAGSASSLTPRVETLETNQSTLQSNQSTTLETLAQHVGNENIHVTETLKNHPANAAVHVPTGGTSEDVLTKMGNVAVWQRIFDLLPQTLQDIVTNNGSLSISAHITPESLYNAMMETIASYWDYHPINPFRHSPLETKRIYSAVYGERFVMVGDGGTIAWSYVGTDWRLSDNNPFGQNTPIVDVCYGADTDNTALYLAIDTTNKYAFSRNGRTWIPAFSYSEALTGSEFRCCLFGNQTFLIFTNNGRVLRATFSQTNDPWKPNGQGINWMTQTSPDGTTTGIYNACFGLGLFVGVGEMGKIVTSENGAHWIQQNSPFGGSNIYDIAFGSGRLVAVGADGKIGVSTNGTYWTVIDDKPFGTNGIYSVTYGFGSFIAADVVGQVATSTDGLHWHKWETPVQEIVRAICFGNATIAIGSDRGEIAVSQSLSKKFTNVDMGDFQEYRDNNVEWFAEIERQFAANLEMIAEALAHKPDLGTERAREQSFATNESGTSYIGTVGQSLDAAPIDHQHPSNLAIGQNINSQPLHKTGHAGSSAMAARYDHIHPSTGLVLTEEVGAENGVAPLDAQALIPLQFIRHGWDWNGLYATLNQQNVNRWSILPNPMFEDIVSGAVIYDIASTARTVVAVGANGRIGYGNHIRRLKRASDHPFDNLPVVGVAAGSNAEDEDLFIAIDTTNRYALSQDGDAWTVPMTLNIEADIEGIMFGGGRFLIWDSNGYIYRSVWIDEELTFQPQTSSPLNTIGLRSITFADGIYVGVGDDKIVTSYDAAGWTLETFPDDISPLMHVFYGNGFFVGIGLNGTIITSDNGKNWTKIIGQTADFYSGCYYDGVYLIGGRDGVLISSLNTPDQWTSPLTTNMTSIIRGIHRHSDVFVIGNDAGQIACSSTFRELLGMIAEDNLLKPFNDFPLPLQPLADPGISDKWARGDHIHPTDGLVLLAMIGAVCGVAPLDENTKIPEPFMPWQRGEPNGVASLDENGKVPDEQIGRSEPNGVAPLGSDKIVPKEFLPPTEIDIEQIVNVIMGGGVGFEFFERISPFPQGVGISSIIHDGAFGVGVAVLVGESGIGFSENDGITWSMSQTQPFGNVPVVGVAFGMNDLDEPIFVTIDTEKHYSVSCNGKDWESIYTLSGDYDFEAITYFNRTFVILCSNGVILRSVFDDGELLGFDEQADSPNITAYCNDIVGGNGLFVTVGNGGKICIAADASHFTVTDSPTTEDLLSACFGKATFLIGGANNTLMIGTDGTDFVKITSPFTGSAAIAGTGYDIDNGLFIVTNTNGEIATSSNLTEWTKQTPQPSAVRIKAITSGNNSVILGDDSGNVYSSRVNVVINYPNGDGVLGNNTNTKLLEGEYDSETGEWCMTARKYDENGLPTEETVELHAIIDTLPPQSAVDLHNESPNAHKLLLDEIRSELENKIPNQYGGVEQANGHRGGYWITDQNFNIVGSHVVAVVSWWYTDTKTEETYNRVLPNATENNPGMQSPEDVKSLHKCQNDIIALNGNTTYLDEYAFGEDRPTDEVLTEYAQEQKGDLYNGNYHYSVVNSNSGIEYISNGDGTWAEFGNANVNIATNNTAGIIKGDDSSPFKCNVQSDGTLAVNELPELAATVTTIGSQVNGMATSKADNSSLATVAKIGSYNDLSNKPTIPTIPVTSVAGKTGAVTLAKADVGLSNVDNTADANKPVSTVQQTALNTKQDKPTNTVTRYGINGTNNVITGINNTIIGAYAGQVITTGTGNTAIGANALDAVMSSASNNTAIGFAAGYKNKSNTTLTYIQNCTYLGANIIGTEGTSSTPTLNEVAIGNGTNGHGTHTVTLGNSNVTSLYVADIPIWENSITDVNFYVDSAGTDDVFHGRGTGANAFKTFDYAVATLSKMAIFKNVNLFLAAGQTFTTLGTNALCYNIRRIHSTSSTRAILKYNGNNNWFLNFLNMEYNYINFIFASTGAGNYHIYIAQPAVIASVHNSIFTNESTTSTAGAFIVVQNTAHLLISQTTITCNKPVNVYVGGGIFSVSYICVFNGATGMAINNDIGLVNVFQPITGTSVLGVTVPKNSTGVYSV